MYARKRDLEAFHRIVTVRCWDVQKAQLGAADALITRNRVVPNLCAFGGGSFKVRSVLFVEHL